MSIFSTHPFANDILHQGVSASKIVYNGEVGYAKDGREVLFTDPNQLPVLLTKYSQKISGSHAPGSTLTRPSHSWTTPGSPIREIYGSWYKNGIDTGVVSETYSDTIDGDVIEWRETAANRHGSRSYEGWPEHVISAQVGILADESKIALEAMTQGLPGGAQNMEIFSSFDHVAGTYTRNPDMWAASLVDSALAAAVVYKTRSVSSYGGVLITPRHVLYCNHAKPKAAGTWEVNYSDMTPIMIRFVLADGTVIETEQLAQSASNPSWPGYYDGPASEGRFYPDLCVATLADDVAAQGVPVIPIMEMRSFTEYQLLRNLAVPVFAATQGYGRATSVVPPTPLSDYPQEHNQMIAIGPSSSWLGESLGLFAYTVWDGDSGAPSFVIHRGQVYLEGIMNFGGWGRIPPGLYLSDLNGMLAASDNDAVARGRLASPTGLNISGSTLQL